MVRLLTSGVLLKLSFLLIMAFSRAYEIWPDGITRLGAGKVVNQPSLKQMWTPVQLNGGASVPYGYGWSIAERQGHRMIMHSGIMGVEYTRFPDDKLTVIVLTSRGSRINETEVNSWGHKQRSRGALGSGS